MSTSRLKALLRLGSDEGFYDPRATVAPSGRRQDVASPRTEDADAHRAPPRPTPQRVHGLGTTGGWGTW